MKRTLTLVSVLLALASGCTRQNERKDELSAALYRTETKPRIFTLTERTAAPTSPRGISSFEMRGIIEDDYRYRVDGYTNGKLFGSEVVVDDARALRVRAEEPVKATDPQTRALLLSIEAIPAETRAELLDGEWLIDRNGANALFEAKENVPGQSTAEFDRALGVLQQVRGAMGEAAAVQLFNPESQDYRPKFDPFPAPEEDTLRYDLVPPVLTPRDPTTASGRAQQLPGLRYFRRMSVYVRDGVVHQVRARVSVEDMLNDPRSRLAARIGDYGITLPDDASVAARAQYLMDTLNATAVRLQQPRVIDHETTVTFGPLGPDDVVKLPTEAHHGNLARVRQNSQVLYETPG